MTDKATYLASIGTNARALADAARQVLEAPVPSCPGWTAGHVVAHVGRAYRWIGEIVRTRCQTPLAPHPDRFGFDRTKRGLFDWFDESLVSFLEALDSADTAEHVWTWAPDDQSAGFWLRLMTHETALHRYDAQLAHGGGKPIEAEIARDGVDYTLDLWLPIWRPGSLLPSGGESYHFHRTDGEGEWLVRFDRDEMRVSREHAKADVALRGTASGLMLFLWRRAEVTEQGFEVFGDAALLDRFFELLPPQ